MKLKLIALSGLVLLIGGLAHVSAQSADPSISDALGAQTDLKSVTAIVAQANAPDVLNGGAVALFAPSDDAFGKLPDATKTAIQASPESAKSFVLSHLVVAKVTQDTLKTTSTLSTADGKSLSIQYDATANAFVLNGSVKVVRAVPVKNGTLFVVDGVLTGK